MSKFEIVIKPYGDSSILVEWPQRIEDRILDDILQFTSTILSKEKEHLLNHTPAYNSLLLQYDSPIDVDQKRHFLQTLYQSQNLQSLPAQKCWHIPVCYDEEFALDLPLYAQKGLSSSEVVALHTTSTYRVYMVGFLPGFLYLGGLSEKLHMDRKATPRSKVPKGTVAIGGGQTGIYPMTSPGGWQIIGRTPLTLFDLSMKNPTPIQQGDHIQFYAIDIDTYHALSSFS